MAKQLLQSNDPHKPIDDEGGTSRMGALRAALQSRLPRMSKRAAVVAGVVSLLVLINLVVLVVWLPAILKSTAAPPATLPMALAALDRHALVDAKHLATSMQKSPLFDARDRGSIAFVLGAAAAAEAEVLPEADRRTAYQAAARDLEEARVRGFPAGRQSEGLFLLGKCLYSTGDYAACRTALEAMATAEGASNPAELAMLADAYFRGPNPDEAKARQTIERYLAFNSLAPNERASALLLKARILDRQGDQAGCQAALAQIPHDSSSYAATATFEAERLMRQARAIVNQPNGETQRARAEEVYRQAIEKLKVAQSRGDATSAVAIRAAYLLGVCQQECGDAAAALHQFQQIRNQSPTSAEAIAAEFQTAQLLRRKGQIDDAIAMLRRVVQTMGNVAAEHNEYLPLDELRGQVLALYDECLRTAQFDRAAQLSRSLYPLFGHDRELELTAELQYAAAKSCLTRSETASVDEGKLLLAKARAGFRQAGQAFTRLAELHTTSRSYTDDLWNAADCFVQGHDYRNAVQSLEAYLENELRRRRATALLLLGESRLALGETKPAMVALDECVDAYASDPASFRARLLAAKARRDAGETDAAEEMLRVNLEEGGLSPRSVEWRDSLFALGSLHEIAGRFSDAIVRLEEAVAQYPDAPQAIEARFLIAESYRHLAGQVQQKLADAQGETVRQEYGQEIQRDLLASIEQYARVQGILADRRQHGDSDPLNLAIFRNCSFGLGSALYELGRYEDAVRVYAGVTIQCRNEPEALEAFIQMAACYRKLDRMAEARGAIAQAKTALARIGKQADFKLTTNYDRDQWNQVLDQMATL